jgi:hypothetical protein
LGLLVRDLSIEGGKRVQVRSNRRRKSPSRSSLKVVETRYPLRRLTDDEEEELSQLEQQIKTAFYICGLALHRIHQKKLFEANYDSFALYCREKFGFSGDYAYLLIAAAAIYQNLELNLPTNGRCLPLPTNERQLRPIVKAKLAPEMQVEVWCEAVSLAGGAIPNGRIVTEVLQNAKESISLSNPFRIGEICQIIAKDNPDLKGKGGTWCIVSSVDGEYCTVDTWDARYVLRVDYLKSLHYSLKECQQVEDLGVRMTQLHNTGRLEETARVVLQAIASLKRSYLTPVEEKLLSCLEEEYEIE